MAAKQIPLNQILSAMDRKDRDFYDNLDDELKKKFSPFLMVRYCSSVSGSPDLENYYIASTNYYANKNLLDLSKHPKLQWLMFTAASPGAGVMRHNWIKQKPKPKNSVLGLKKELIEYFPEMKDDDLDFLSTLVTKKELKEYAKQFGEK